MRKQMTHAECPIKIKAGDVIRFTNNRDYDVTITVDKVEEKSWYYMGSRNSYGTLIGHSKMKNFRIN